MKLLTLVLLGALVVPVAVQAQTQAPLLDRELFFGDPEISGAQLSPDGQYISFIKPFKGTRNVWVKKAGEPFTAAKVLTADTKRPVTQYFWARDSKYVLYVQDQGGDENYNVYAVDPAAAPAAGADVPAARNVTDAKGARALIYDVPKKEPGILYVGLNDRDKAWHDLYRLEIATGKRTLMRQNTEKIAGWVFDNAGKLRLAARTTDSGSTEILRVDDKAFTPVYTCSVFESCGPVHFHKDGQRVYLETSKGEGDLSRLTLFDPATGKEELVESDPLKKVDFGFGDVLRHDRRADRDDRTSTTRNASTSATRPSESDLPSAGEEAAGPDREPRDRARRTSSSGSSARPATSSPVRRSCSTARPSSSPRSTRFARSCHARHSRR